MADHINQLIELSLGVFLGVILIGGALTIFANYSTEGWDANTALVWSIIGVVVVICFVLILYGSVRSRGK